MGKLSWSTCSPTVKFDGKGVIRFSEVAGHNGNQDNTFTLVLGDVSVAYPFESPDDLCPNCGQTKDETELQPGGEAHLKRHGPGATEQDLKPIFSLVKTPKVCISNAGAAPQAAANGSTPPAVPPR